LAKLEQLNAVIKEDCDRVQLQVN